MNNKYQKAKNDAIGQIPEREDDPIQEKDSILMTF